MNFRGGHMYSTSERVCETNRFGALEVGDLIWHLVIFHLRRSQLLRRAPEPVTRSRSRRNCKAGSNASVFSCRRALLLPDQAAAGAESDEWLLHVCFSSLGLLCPKTPLLRQHRDHISRPAP